MAELLRRLWPLCSHVGNHPRVLHKVHRPRYDPERQPQLFPWPARNLALRVQSAISQQVWIQSIDGASDNAAFWRSTTMKRARAVQVSRPGGPFEMVEREIPEPGPRQVRIKVQACGLCHSDALTKEGHWPGIKYPRVPGHEIAGVIDAVGSEVPQWKPGQRVGVGWLGGYCGYCASCRHGSFVTCANQLISGISMDGGYQDYVSVPFEGLALIPDDLSPNRSRPADVRRHHNVQLFA